MTAFPSPPRTHPGAMPARSVPPSVTAKITAQHPQPQPQPKFAAVVTRDADTARALVLSIIARIEGIAEEETAALEKSSTFDFRMSNDRKSQALVDLNQAMRRLKKVDLTSDFRVRVAQFRQKLVKNLDTIRLHMNAVKEIASVLSDAIQRSESDGTYSRRNPYRNAP